MSSRGSKQTIGGHSATQSSNRTKSRKAQRRAAQQAIAAAATATTSSEVKQAKRGGSSRDRLTAYSAPSNDNQHHHTDIDSAGSATDDDDDGKHVRVRGHGSKIAASQARAVVSRAEHQEMALRELARERVDDAVEEYTQQVVHLTTLAKARPTNDKIKWNDEYGQRKATGAERYHRQQTHTTWSGHSKGAALASALSQTFGGRRTQSRYSSVLSHNIEQRYSSDTLEHMTESVYGDLHPLQFSRRARRIDVGAHCSGSFRRTHNSRTAEKRDPHCARRTHNRSALAAGRMFGSEGMSSNNDDGRETRRSVAGVMDLGF